MLDRLSVEKTVLLLLACMNEDCDLHEHGWRSGLSVSQEATRNFGHEILIISHSLRTGDSFHNRSWRAFYQRGSQVTAECAADDGR